MKRKKRVLVAPLDWGLGHTTRCIPIIHELLKRDVDVLIGADNHPRDLLKREFPQLEHIQFPGHVVRYGEHGNLIWEIIKQLPAMVYGFRREHQLLESLIAHHSIDGVISDNRFGAFSKKVPSIFIIHQLNIIIPTYLLWAKRIVDFSNRQFVQQYTECWIPDFSGEKSLAGILSSPKVFPTNALYIGTLSRLKKIDSVKKEYDILVILSGPEPQRGLFEQILIEQLRQTQYKVLIVRGIPNEDTTIEITRTISMVSVLTTDELSLAIAQSHLIISRSGHSTIMDLSFVGAKALFVPTPQQTEHEYLADLLKKKNICYSENQNEFNLERAVTINKKFTGFNEYRNDYSILRERIDYFLRIIDTSTL